MGEDQAVHEVSNLTLLFEKVRRAAASTSLLLVYGVPKPKADWSWDGGADEETEFISIAAHAKARLIYYDMEVFELEPLVSAQIMGSDLVSEYDYDYEAKVSSITEGVLHEFQHWAERNGENCTLVLQFVANGICHELVQSPEWFDRFVAEISQHIDGLEQSSRIASESELERIDTAMKDQAEALARSDRYARARNDGQRRYVANDMFPDATPEYIGNLLELSALIYWDKIEPEREKSLVDTVGTLNTNGLSLTQIAAQLGVTKDRANRLLAIALASKHND